MPDTRPQPLWRMALFIAAGVAAAGPWSRTDVALLAGIVLAVLGLSQFHKPSKVLSKYLIQACVVLLGLRLDLGTLAHAAMDGLALAVGTIAGAMALGLSLGALLRSGREVSLLVSSGTAICGGSAIAAVGSSVRASSTNMAVATGAIFVLNAVGLWTLPWIGHALHLSDAQFGAWAGVALHDIASVGGAAKGYHASAGATGSVALDTANVVKLIRVVWIAPIAFAAGWWWKRAGGEGARGGQPFPWFILGFLAASAARTWVPGLAEFAGRVPPISGVGFQLALFLIGAGLSPAALRTVGWRALAQAAVLWVAVAGASLWVIRSTGEQAPVAADAAPR